MAAARKCDRCGNFFMPDITNSGHRNNFIRLNTYCTTGSTTGSDIHTLDLCNECFESLEKWISNGEMKGETE